MKERAAPHPDAKNMESRRPSRLLTVGLALLTLSALYLLGPARAAMGWSASVAVLLHIGLGLLLMVPILIRSVKANGSGFAGSMALFRLLFGVCALTGLALTLRAAIGASTAHDRGIWWTHLLAGLLAALAFTAWLARRRRWLRLPLDPPAILSSGPSVFRPLRPLTFATATAAVCSPRRPPIFLYLCFFALSTLGLGGAALLPHYDADAYYRDITATNATQGDNPFFPAGVRLAPASRSTGADADYCGRIGCHATALREWHGSAHRQAGADPVYRRVLGEYRAQAGTKAALWCAGCHEPLRVVQSGGLSLTAASGAAHSANEGVDCVTCHAMTDVSARTGNGRFTLSLPQNYPFAERQKGWQRRLHDFLLHVRPTPHQTAYLKPEIHAGSEFCGTCHRQSFNVPQNGYQFVHGSDEWGTWQSGPFSGRSARTAGLRTETPRSCQDCHSPHRADGSFSHASAAGLRWSAVPARERLLTSPEPDVHPRGLSVDVFALRRLTKLGQQEEWIAPLDTPRAVTALRAGETCLLDIVVSNRDTGHEFPAGYMDIEEAWLEVTLRDSRGRVLAESGQTRPNGAALPADTHAYRSIPLDRAGNALNHHELWKQVTTATRRSIPSGGSDIARYRMTLPHVFTPPLTIQARLRYRALRPDFAQWVGISTPPITTLAEAQTMVPPNSASARNRTETVNALRFVDYGLGLLAPKDAPDAARARRAFLAAQHLAPNRPEPFLGLGRAYLAEPELLAARAQFDAALRLTPGNPAAQADLGVVYSKQGEYDRALSLLRPLALQFPQDGALQFDLGLTLFRSGDYRAAVSAFENSLAADPDNAAAHFQLKQCFQHLQRVPEARREEAIGQYLAEDRLLPALLPPYLRLHPELRQIVQPIPEHRLRSDQR